MCHTSTFNPAETTFNPLFQDLHTHGCKPQPGMSGCHRWEGEAAPTASGRSHSSSVSLRGRVTSAPKVGVHKKPVLWVKIWACDAVHLQIETSSSGSIWTQVCNYTGEHLNFFKPVLFKWLRIYRSQSWKKASREKFTTSWWSAPWRCNYPVRDGAEWVLPLSCWNLSMPHSLPPLGIVSDYQGAPAQEPQSSVAASKPHFNGVWTHCSPKRFTH